jgi:predicted secreted protein
MVLERKSETLSFKRNGVFYFGFKTTILMTLAVFLIPPFPDHALPETGIQFALLIMNPLACSFPEGREIMLSEIDDGREITVQVGDRIHLELKLFGSTGYDWYLDQSYEQNFELLKDEKKEFYGEIHGKGLVGTPLLRIWELRAAQKGERDITLRLYRDWEGKDRAVKKFAIGIKIL